MEATPMQPSAPIEDEKFWQNHGAAQKTSGLTRAKYCRQTGLNYYRFGYWLSKQIRNQTRNTRLISIKVKPTDEPATQSILCTLNLTGGHCLKIHDIKALSVILDKMR